MRLLPGKQKPTAPAAPHEQLAIWEEGGRTMYRPADPVQWLIGVVRENPGIRYDDALMFRREPLNADLDNLIAAHVIRCDRKRRLYLGEVTS